MHTRNIVLESAFTSTEHNHLTVLINQFRESLINQLCNWLNLSEEEREQVKALISANQELPDTTELSQSRIYYVVNLFYAKFSPAGILDYVANSYKDRIKQAYDQQSDDIRDQAGPIVALNTPERTILPIVVSKAGNTPGSSRDATGAAPDAYRAICSELGVSTQEIFEVLSACEQLLINRRIICNKNVFSTLVNRLASSIKDCSNMTSLVTALKESTNYGLWLQLKLEPAFRPFLLKLLNKAFFENNHSELGSFLSSDSRACAIYLDIIGITYATDESLLGDHFLKFRNFLLTKTAENSNLNSSEAQLLLKFNVALPQSLVQININTLTKALEKHSNAQSRSSFLYSSIYHLLTNYTGWGILENILKNKNYSSLVTKIIEIVLFEMPYAHTALLCWFIHSSDKATKNLFQDIMKKQAWAKKITVKDLCTKFPSQLENNAQGTALYDLSSATGDNDLDILAEIFRLNPPIETDNSELTSLLGKALCARDNPPDSEFANHSALLQLLSLDRGKKIFNMLLDSYPELPNAIQADTLYALIPQQAGPEANSSALTPLVLDAEGFAILNKLFTGNPQLIKQVPIDTLCALTQSMGEDVGNVSVFYLLTLHPAGLDLLSKILANNPDLAKQIRDKTIFAKGGKQFAMASPLDHLATSPEGIKILLDIFKSNPYGLARLITVTDLFRFVPVYTVLKSNLSMSKDAISVSVFGQLARDIENGHKILALIFAQQPNLGKIITTENLCPAASFEDNGSLQSKLPSPVLALISSPIGLELFSQLVNASSNFYKQITWKVLSWRFKQPDHPSFNTTFLFHLIKTDSGFAIFRKLLEKNPELAKEFTAEILCARSKENVSVLYMLCMSDERCALLKNILQLNSALCSQIDGRALCTTTIPNGDFVLHRLTFTNTGIEILDLLISANPALANEAIWETIYEAYIARKTPEAVIFYNLLRNPLGHHVLIKILKAKPALGMKVSAKALTEFTNISTLYLLTCYPNTRNILAFFFLCNKELQSQIKGSDLCKIVSGTKGSILFNITVDQSFHTVVKQWFTNNKDLIAEITPQALYTCLSSAAGGKSWDNTSTFANLTLHVSGLDILKILFDGNLDLIKAMTFEDLCVKAKNSDRPCVLSLLESKEGKTILRNILDANLTVKEKLQAYITENHSGSAVQTNFEEILQGTSTSVFESSSVLFQPVSSFPTDQSPSPFPQ